MIVTEHHFLVAGQIVTTDVFVGTSEEWESDPRSQNPEWCVWRSPRSDTVIASNILIPRDLIATRPYAYQPGELRRK
jgi:hypothetical protein